MTLTSVSKFSVIGMDPTTTAPSVGPSSLPPPTPATRPDTLPWPSLIVLGTATLVMVTGEMLPTAVLPQMSAGLGVTEASTGLLVSLWAGVVVVASFPLVRLTRGLERRTVIAASMIAFAASAAITALAPTYQVALAGRLVGAAAVGLLWSTVNAHVADLVSDRMLGRATAVVLGGATLGMVVGTPVGRLVADLAGWRFAFWTLAGVGVVTATLVRVVVAARSPHSGADDHAVSGAAGGTPSRSAGPMVMVTVLVAVTLVGHYGVYTYITRLAEEPARALPGGMSTLLLIFGLASAAGVVVAGRVGTRTERALVMSVAATAATVLGLTIVGTDPVVGLAVVIAWGVASGGLPPLAQTLILRLGGPQRRSVAGALIPVLFNGGVAAGAALASALVARTGPAAVPVPAAVVVALAAAGLAVQLGVSRSRAAAVVEPEGRS